MALPLLKCCFRDLLEAGSARSSYSVAEGRSTSIRSGSLTGSPALPVSYGIA